MTDDRISVQQEEGHVRQLLTCDEYGVHRRYEDGGGCEQVQYRFV